MASDISDRSSIGDPLIDWCISRNLTIEKWLQEPPGEQTCLYRRQFIRTYPILAGWIGKDLQTVKDLTSFIDRGESIVSGPGFAALMRLFTDSGVYYGHNFDTKDLSPQTIKAYVKLRPEEWTPFYSHASHSDYFFYLDSELPAFNALPPSSWPQDDKQIIAFAWVAGSSPLASARGFIDNAGDWEGLASAAERDIHRRHVAIAEDNIYAERQRAAAQGKTWEGDIQPDPIGQETLSETGQRLKDYLSEIIDVILKPAFYSAGRPPRDCDDWGLEDIIRVSAPLRQFITASEAWHEPRRWQRVSAEIYKLYMMEPAWLPMIEPLTIPHNTRYKGQEIGGFSFVEATTQSDLVKLAEIMRNCVHSYGRRCMSSKRNSRFDSAHIFTLSTPAGKPISTIHLGENQDTKDAVTLHANLSFSDSHPPPKAVAAGLWLEHAINNGEVTQVTSAEIRDINRQKFLESLGGQIWGFDAKDPAILSRVFNLYKPLMPRAWHKCRDGLELWRMMNETAVRYSADNIAMIERGRQITATPSAPQL